MSPPFLLALKDFFSNFPLRKIDLFRIRVVSSTFPPPHFSFSTFSPQSFSSLVERLDQKQEPRALIPSGSHVSHIVLYVFFAICGFFQAYSFVLEKEFLSSPRISTNISLFSV